MVLFFQTGAPEIVRRKFAGVMSFAGERGVNVKLIGREAAGRSLKKMLAFWKPDGCIVEASGGARGFESRAFGKTPVVYMCHDPSQVGKGLACVTSDSPAVARLAAGEFHALGFHHFAFVGWHTKIYWSDAKRDVFCEEARKYGCSCAVFASDPRDESDEIAFQKRLRGWLTDLPKPCAVLAAADSIGTQVLLACEAQRIKVPSQVAVLGVNNDEELCTSAFPNLSSVRLDYHMTGRRAAELLNDILSGHPRTGHFTVPPGGIVRRASTRLLHSHSPEIRHALDLIRKRACEGLRPTDVLNTFSCSRRSAEMHFKAATGRTIAQEVQSVRMEKVHALLARRDVPISLIAGECGWPSESFLRRLFRRETGLSLKEARERLLGPKPPATPRHRLKSFCSFSTRSSRSHGNAARPK